MMGKYELIRKLASGGMAEVFLARAAGPMGFEKKLVVKRILPHLVADSEFVEMFLSEAKLAAQLSHPNIVQIFDFGDADGTYFLAMEYIDGPNLRVLSERACERGTPIPFPLCAKIISYACEALTYAHDSVDAETGKPLQLIHRDISPDNILLARNGAVKVVDFGIAKVANQHHTRVGWIKGKISYMPPEQLKTERLDRRADVYALGVVLYELVTAQKPHDADSDVALIHAILNESITPVKSRRPDVPKELERIVHKALAKDREERYPNCREMQVDLDRFLLDLGETAGAFELSKLVADLQAEPEAQQPIRRSRSKATTVPSKGQAKPSAAATVMLPQDDSVNEHWEDDDSEDPPEVLAFQAGTQRRKLGLIALIGAALLVAGGVGAFWWLGRTPSPVPSVATRLAEPASPPEEPVPPPEEPVPPPKEPVSPPEEPVSPPEEPVSPPEEPVSPPVKRPSLPPPEPEQDPVVSPVAKKPPTRVPEKPLPEPEPEEQQSQPVKAPRPDPAAPKLASLKIISEPVAFVRIGKKRGKSPFTAAVPPGEVVVEVYDKERGFSKTARFNLKAGSSEVQKVVVGKGSLVLRSVPYASVFLDGKALGETPLEQVEAYEGKHTVKFVCPKLNQENVQEIELAPGEKKIVKARYP